MLDVALVNFVGAGLASFAPVYGLNVPPGAISNGTLLIRSLYQHDRAGTQDIVEATVQAIWQEWISSGMPNSVAEAHLARLPQILEENQPDPDILVAAYAVTNAAAKLTVTAIEAQSRRLSTDIIEKARNGESDAAHGLSEAVTFFFLEALYRNLLPARQYVDDAKSRLQSFLVERSWEASNSEHQPAAMQDMAGDDDRPSCSEQEDDRTDEPPVASHHPAAPAKSDRAQAQYDDHESRSEEPEANCELETSAGEQQIEAQPVEFQAVDAKSKEALAAAIRTALAKRVGRDAAEKRDIERSIALGCELAASLSGCKDTDSEFISFVQQAHQHLLNGALAETQSVLAVAENAKQNSARAEPDSRDEHLRAAAEARCWRAQLQELAYEFRSASRHYATAAGHLSDTDFEHRWRYTKRQIMAMVRLDEEFAEADALVEATKTCTSHVVVLLDERARSSQAEAKLLLGELLITLGQREADAERFRLAAGHLKEALSYYHKSDRKDLQSRAMLLWADASAGLGAAGDDPKKLEEAIRAYKDLHSSSKSATNPIQAHQISAKLGIVLSQLGTTMENADILDVAIETLRGSIEALDDGENAERPSRKELIGRANAALARAIVAKSGALENDEALPEAEAIYRLAIAALSGTRARMDLKKLCNEHTALRQRGAPDTAIGEDDEIAGPHDDQAVPPQQVGAAKAEPSTGGGYLSRLRTSLKLANDTPDDPMDKDAVKSA